MFATDEMKLAPFPSLLWLALISAIYLGVVSFVFLVIGNFDWTLFLIGVCFDIMSVTTDYIFLKKINNNEEIIKIKFELYNTIKNKPNIVNTIYNIVYSRNKNVISNIIMLCLNNKNIDLTLIEYKVKCGTIIGYLRANKLDNKALKQVEKQLKIYNYKDDFNEMLRQVETKELIQKQEIGGFAVIITIISFMLAILCFFRVDYASININQNLIYITIYFVFTTFYMLKKNKDYKNQLITIYLTINQIFKSEKFS